MNIYFRRIDNENIIHIKCDDDIDNEIREDAEIDINENEIDVFYIINKNIISYSRRLFQIIKCFIQLINLKRILFENEIMRLFYINLFFDLIIKENDFDVHLFQVSIFDNDECENHFIWHRFDHRGESFIVIQFFALFEVSHYSTSFITNNLIIKITLKNVNSFIIKCNALFE